MSVLERLRELREPLWSDVDYFEWTWEPRESMRAVDWRPRLRLPRSVMLNRIDEAAAGWSLRAIFRRMNSRLAKAIRQVTPEFEWLQEFPVEAITASGNENRGRPDDA